MLTEVAGGWQLRTDPDSGEFVRRFLRVKPQRLTRAALETLAIIAYRQPVTRPEIEDVRGRGLGRGGEGAARAAADQDPRQEGRGRPAHPLRHHPRVPRVLRAEGPLGAAHPPRVPRAVRGAPHARGHRGTGAGPGTENLVEELADPAFEQGLDAAAPGAEEAMDALEQAMEEAEARSKAAAASLGAESPDTGSGARGDRQVSERLQKFLARAGVASRRHAEGLITAGRVTREQPAGDRARHEGRAHRPGHGRRDAGDRAGAHLLVPAPQADRRGDDALRPRGPADGGRAARGRGAAGRSRSAGWTGTPRARCC